MSFFKKKTVATAKVPAGEEKNAANAQKQGRLCRLGGIVTSLFPDISIVVNQKIYTILLRDDTRFAEVTIHDDGHLAWGKFDDSGFDSRKYGAESSHDYYDSKIEEVEKLYYSPDYENAESDEAFVRDLESWRYSGRKSRYKSCLYLIAFIIIAILYFAVTN